MTAQHSPSGSMPAEAEAFLDAHPEIEAFDIILHDSNGIGRGKIIRRHELLSFYKNGRHLPISILGLDICGEDVHETGLIWDQGDGDLRAWPIPGTLVPLHNTTPPRGEVLMSLYDLDGAPMSSDPRHALQRQVDALASEGLHPAGAFELEFFLLANERGPDGKMQPARDVLDGRKS
ncbi:MAG: glutamine synthetase, partial [Pseudotabrizicola sp.]|nr:glutamine synthetase [Pseudotabrizicola sp.]